MREYSIAFRLLNGRLSFILLGVFLTDDVVNEWVRDGYIAIDSGLYGLPRI